MHVEVRQAIRFLLDTDQSGHRDTICNLSAAVETIVRLRAALLRATAIERDTLGGFDVVTDREPRP
ncbi:MAG: hypothetical protein KGL39_03460 [Patescibacteria group bacterium]|nr:hypothetical protein [Patescibacteria group bacterium]